MNKLNLIRIALIFIICSCNSSNNMDELGHDNYNESSKIDSVKQEFSQTETDVMEKELQSVSETKGFIVATDLMNFGSSFFILNSDHEIIDTITRIEEKTVIAIPCFENRNGFYEVSYNNDTAFIATNNEYIIFESWEGHILNLTCVDFDHESNPIRVSPNQESKTKLYKEDQFYLPVSINDNWLQIKWDYGNKYEFGWIQWKQRDKLIIEFYYFL